MFELSVAYKYLMPRWRQLSVSIISMISILVISLVVWLILVFFSVTDGLEKLWVEKLIALTAPVRITPTEAYYRSYYYLVDGISASSQYTLKTLTEKRDATVTDPYDPDMDEEIPSSWLIADREKDGSLKDIVKKTFQAIEQAKGVPPLTYRDFEIAFSNIHLRLVRSSKNGSLHTSRKPPSTDSAITHTAYLGSFDPTNEQLKKTFIPLESADLANLTNSFAFSPSTIDEEMENRGERSPQEFRELLKNFFQNIKITHLKVSEYGWVVPRHLLPTDLANKEPVTLPGGIVLPARLVEDSLLTAKKLQDVLFLVEIPLSDKKIDVKAPLGTLEIAGWEYLEKPLHPFWIYSQNGLFVLPQDNPLGEGILLPRGFREAGVLLGDQGFLSYYAATTSSLQEQRIPIYVAGFFDPGIMPMGGKLALVNQPIVSSIRSVQEQNDPSFSTGINVRFHDLSKAPQVKLALQDAFREAGVDHYWRVETFREYEFTKDLLQQLQSEKNLFSLISIVIIIVACSNIISMLIILVNDKKKEIGILMAMGATPKSIAAIFGLCGIIMGALGSLIGLILALFTLHHLQSLVGFLGRLQGHDLFNAHFYGNTLPNELSFGALLFVMITTVVISFLAGIIPAIKASLVRPSTILRSE